MALLVVSGAVPLALSFFAPLGIYRHWRALAGSISLVAVFFGIWDAYAVWRGHWYFSPEGVWRFRILGLPLEEILFFVVIPFCCIFTWEALVYIRERLR